MPEGKRFHFFLSHKQQGADGYAALVKEKLKALGYSCRIDTEQTADREGISHACCSTVLTVGGPRFRINDGLPSSGCAGA